MPLPSKLDLQMTLNEVRYIERHAKALHESIQNLIRGQPFNELDRRIPELYGVRDRLSHLSQLCKAAQEDLKRIDDVITIRYF